MLVFGIVLFVPFSPRIRIDKPRTTPMTARTESKPESVIAYFDAKSLIGKNQSGVNQILGNPVESWTVSTDSERQMSAYRIGEDTTVEFYHNQIDSLVIFFKQKNVDKATAYKLVGLDLNNGNPTGISSANTGDDWIKIRYSK
jgi:hypothetical protein